MNFKPLLNNVLVEPLAGEQKTQSGIIIPDTSKEKPQKGRIVATGDGRYEDGKLLPVAVKVNDVVMYGKYSGTEIKIDGKEYMLVKDTELLGIIN